MSVPLQQKIREHSHAVRKSLAELDSWIDEENSNSLPSFRGTHEEAVCSQPALQLRESAANKFKAGEFSDSASLYQKYLLQVNTLTAEEKSNVSSYISLCYYKLGNMQQSKRFAKAALDSSETMKAYFRLGVACRHLGEFEDALSALCNAQDKCTEYALQVDIEQAMSELRLSISTAKEQGMQLLNRPLAIGQAKWVHLEFPNLCEAPLIQEKSTDLEKTRSMVSAAGKPIASDASRSPVKSKYIPKAVRLGLV